MEAPLPKKNEKVVELTSNMGNKFIVNFINKNTLLFISLIQDNGIEKKFFESNYTLEKIKENKAFGFHESIEEILSELYPLIDEGKIHVIEEEKNVIKINFDLPFQKFKNIEFKINEKKKTDSEKINELYNIVTNQNKEINELKNKVSNLETKQNDEFLDLKNRIEVLEREFKNKKKFEEIDSSIVMSLNKIDFILSRFKKTNKNISLNLLYRATRDGSHCSDFHKKCDGKSQQLIFIKTKEGVIFGGYTKKGFNGLNGSHINDEEAFVFSCSKKKIYDVKQNKNAIFDNKKNGPCFLGVPWYMIYIDDKMLEKQSNTCPVSDSYFQGINFDYELNNGKQYFYIQEIEVYQVLFN